MIREPDQLGLMKVGFGWVNFLENRTIGLARELKFFCLGQSNQPENKVTTFPYF